MRLSFTQLTKRLPMIAAFFMLACQTTTASEPTPAVLTSTDSATMDTLKSVLASALNRKSINFGATDWSSSTVSILPARGHSPSGAPFHQQDFALPLLFDLMIDNRACYLQQRDADIKIPLENISCTPL